jgi:hypothetical protein
MKNLFDLEDLTSRRFSKGKKLHSSINLTELIQTNLSSHSKSKKQKKSRHSGESNKRLNTEKSEKAEEKREEDIFYNPFLPLSELKSSKEKKSKSRETLSSPKPEEEPFLTKKTYSGSKRENIFQNLEESGVRRKGKSMYTKRKKGKKKKKKKFSLSPSNEEKTQILTQSLNFNPQNPRLKQMTIKSSPKKNKPITKSVHFQNP